MRPQAIVKLLIVNEKGEILFLRRSATDTRRPGQWDLPGGMVDGGEDLTAAAKRETQEEAGLELRQPRVVYGYSEPRPPYGYPTWIFFMDHVTGPVQVHISSEHDAHQWMTPAAALAAIQYSLHQRVLRYVIDNRLLEQPAV